MESEKRNELLRSFDFGGEVTGCIPYGSGYINDTFRVTVKRAEGEKRYILQRMNHSVFAHPEEMMENIVGVTGFLRRKILAEGGNPERETLNVVPAADGKPYYKDADGQYWRVYLFIEGARTYDRVPAEQIFYESAYAFGHFQSMLADYPAQTLHETIPDFHNTVKRYNDFTKTVADNASGRLENCMEETIFLQENSDISYILQDRLQDGRLPLRVTHNDTKLNNVMIDEKTGEAVCVVDLDTVMPGLSAMDFGDAIRFGASTAAEDEKDLSRVKLDLHLFEVYARGFLAGCGSALTDEEVRMLPYGALVITYEQALRFLGDYIAGDTYYKTSWPEQNLVRARTQIRLVQQMQENLNDMREMVAALSGRTAV